MAQDPAVQGQAARAPKIFPSDAGVALVAVFHSMSW